MYDQILLPVDEQTGPAEVLHHAGEIAHHFDAEIQILYVADTDEYSVTVVDEGVVDGLVEHGKQVVADVGETLDSLDVAHSADVVQGTPAETIVKYASEYGYDLIVMPTHAREGLSRFLLGSVTEKVVRLADVPVLTARMIEEDAFTFPYERILLPTDSSESSRRAAEHGLDLAAAMDAAVDVLSVVETAALGPDIGSNVTSGDFDQGAHEAVSEVAGMAEKRDVEASTHVETGSPDEEILSAVDEYDCQAVVMGTTGRRGVDRILLGSVAEKTVRSAPVPVVTVREE
ncbi:Nucleotide-binding protein, UspA family [Halorhabdus sp. SVX81]|uniref:universal stress protein n=1 Tax=Halorhabdus sp. SVX81 TaxID=2978283 RepID=UPI0023DBE995|nr:universal stress protein [Halorhabdus sp. SVX81]WEL18992.1 Nucleotide-binding protein, UspA family [Halorhabdus sp. SVX81]